MQRFSEENALKGKNNSKRGCRIPSSKQEIEIKDKYNDATHICYAYIINNNEKSYDDNEPKGTAGLPILNVLKKENLN